MGLNFGKAEYCRSAGAPRDFLHDGRPQFAFAGRSNVGKSSVINRLVNRKNLAYVGASPGKTTQINYFLIDGRAYLVDLPGYGYAKVSQAEKERWARLMETYFQEGTLSHRRRADRGHPAQAHRERWIMHDWFRQTGCRKYGRQQAGQAEKEPGGAGTGPYPGDAGADGAGHPGAVLS